MKKSDIVVGGKYRFNPQGRNNRYEAFSDNEEELEVEVITIGKESWNKGDLEVTDGDVYQTIHWSELKPLKTK